MFRKKSDIAIRTHENSADAYDGKGCISYDCGDYSNKDKSKIFQLIDNMPSPKQRTCFKSISAELKKTTYKIHLQPKEYNLSTTLDINLLTNINNAQCGATTHQQCLECIIAGKCKDKFLIDVLLTKLFADKYQNEK